MITVNLFGESDAHVVSRVLGGGGNGPDALTDAARELEAAEALVER